MLSSNQRMDQDNRLDLNNSVNKITDTTPKSLPIQQSPIVIAQIMDKEQEQPLQQSAKQMQNNYPQYEWDNKWLKGDEYANMLENIEEYCKQYNLETFTKKSHPEDIYRAPKNGLIYFVEGNCVGSEFGFPRVPFRKQYRWKKMNFTTDLPKKKPLVTYIVASSVRCSKQSGCEKSKQDNNKKEQDIYRMHAVILFKNSQAKQQQLQSSINEKSESKNESEKQYILCHIRKIDISEEDKIHSNRPSSNNNSIASESSQDVAGDQKYQNKKVQINNKKSKNGYQEEDEESDQGHDNYYGLKENHIQGKRKSSSMNETKSNNADFYIHQTLTPQDLNKLAKSKSKNLTKQKCKLIDNYQRSSFSQTQKQGAASDICPELLTEQILQQISLNDLSKKHTTNDVINKKIKREDNLNHINLYELQNNSLNSTTRNESSSLRNSLTNGQITQHFANNIQNVNMQTQSQSPNNQKQRSPGNCEVNSITSSSYTNQIQKNNEDDLLNIRAVANVQNNSCISPINFGINNNFINNQMIQYAYPQAGGMMVMQQTYPSIQANTTMIPNYFMNMTSQFPQQYIPDQLNIQQMQVQQQNQIQQQLNQIQLAQQLQLQQKQLQNIRLSPANMEEFSQTFEPNQQAQFIDYLKFYSRQMNNFPSSNTSFIPVTRDSNKQ